MIFINKYPVNNNIENFIGIFPNVVSKESCENYIAHFERLKSAGFGLTRGQTGDGHRLQKDDTTAFLHHPDTIKLMFLDDEFNTAFWKTCYPEYSAAHSNILQNMPAHQINYLRLQKTAVGQGFHSWHDDHGDWDTRSRVLAIILYLNDVEVGGETEFLFYGKRVNPKQGTMLLFPPFYTHTHRGNPPLSNDKYILTGWLEF